VGGFENLISVVSRVGGGGLGLTPVSIMAPPAWLPNTEMAGAVMASAVKADRANPARKRSRELKGAPLATDQGIKVENDYRGI